ncbi:Maf/Ham1 [Clavulina sp. PMI_390]|nr:Maf/Ham1 [Clavulina sp. PMI_390]
MAQHEHVLPNALAIPALNKLAGKRIILASASPRRQEILKTFGLVPEIVPSTFPETLPLSSFENIYEYPVATATEKAVEVYEKLLAANPEDPPELVIGADTVVLSHYTPPISGTSTSLHWETPEPELLEKPGSKEDNLRMLLDLNGKACEVVTGVSVVYPILMAPGYAIKSIDERTLVHFAESPKEVLKAYADSGEGIDRAGGFAAQGMGGHLIRKYDGDFWNVVGFPAASFFKLIAVLIEDEDDFLTIE